MLPTKLPDIALVGKMGSGKDFAGAELVEGLGYTRLALADALKDEVAATYKIPLWYLENNKGKYRTALQEVGVARREQDAQYWVKRWAEARAAIPGPVVCTDCRFINEAEYFICSGALLIKVETPEDIRIARLEQLYGQVPDSILQHPSEQEIAKIEAFTTIRGDLPQAEILPRLLVHIGIRLLPPGTRLI